MEKDKLIQNRKYQDTLYCSKININPYKSSLLVHSPFCSTLCYRKITYLYSVDPLIFTHSHAFHTNKIIILITANISFLTMKNTLTTLIINAQIYIDIYRPSKILHYTAKGYLWLYTMDKRGGGISRPVYYNRSKSLVVRLTLLMPLHEYVSLLCRGAPTLCSGSGLYF